MNKSLRDRFRENKEDIFGYSSVLGFIITVFYTAYAVWIANWDVSFKTIIYTLTAIIFFHFLVNMYILRRYDKLQALHAASSSTIAALHERISALEKEVVSQKNIQVSISKIFHNVCHEYRKRIYTLYCDLSVRDSGQFVRRQSSFEKFLLFFMTNVKEVFDILTGDECAVCIKLIDADEHHKYLVKTYMRDPVSYRQRSETDRSLADFPYHENTAFKSIIKGKGPKAYFISNDLKAESTYVNCNPSWPQLYNATIVVPIRLVTSSDSLSGEECSNVLGFLCVDNMKGNFDEMISVNVLASFADLSFFIFYLVFELFDLHVEEIESSDV